MKLLAPILTLAALALAAPAAAQEPLESGFAGAVRFCEAWILNPDSWAPGTERLEAEVGLGPRLRPTDIAPPGTEGLQLMGAPLRYWHVDAAPGSGFNITVSERMPLCHITGGDPADLKPVIDAVTGSEAFKHRWEVHQRTWRSGGVRTVSYRYRTYSAFTLEVTHVAPDKAREGVQLEVLASYEGM